MTDLVEALEPVARVLLAATLAAPLGWEREAEDEPAGLRTHMLVGLGACCFVLCALGLSPGSAAGADALQIDPLRVVNGVIGGVGFIGAGTILRSHEGVRGLTTAASIWVAAAIGVSVGLSRLDLALGAVAAALLVLALPRALEALGTSVERFAGSSTPSQKETS